MFSAADVLDHNVSHVRDTLALHVSPFSSGVVKIDWLQPFTTRRFHVIQCSGNVTGEALRFGFEWAVHGRRSEIVM